MQVKLPYGKSERIVTIDQPVRPAAPAESQSAVDWVDLALKNPVDSPPLHALARPGESVVIVTSDITRPCPSHVLLPGVLDELRLAGVRDEDVTIMCALGTHRPHTREERRQLVSPQIADRIRTIDSSPRDTVYVGTTDRGTPIEAARAVVEADFVIALGNVELHYFAGYSGGAKALVPGVCSHRTIEHNHAFLTHPDARMGNLDTNPVRLDLEQGAGLIGLDFILNVILDKDGKIQAAQAGHPLHAHRRLCSSLAALRRVELESPAEITLISAGGYPKDINFYQAHKALEAAALVTRPGGIIILLAECGEGVGNAVFEEWMMNHSPDEILARCTEGFVLGGHKAAAIVKLLKRFEIYIISDLPHALAASIGFTPFDSVDAALRAAQAKVGFGANLVLIPKGEAVLPSFNKNENRIQV